MSSLSFSSFFQINSNGLHSGIHHTLLNNLGLSGPFINVYPLFLGATEAQQSTISAIRSVPASFKLIFGFFSDTVPFLGYRRKAYMFIGWMTSSLSMLLLYLWSNLDRVEVETYYKNGDGEVETSVEYQPAEDAPSIQFLSLAVSFLGMILNIGWFIHWFCFTVVMLGWLTHQRLCSLF